MYTKLKRYHATMMEFGGMKNEISHLKKIQIRNEETLTHARNSKPSSSILHQQQTIAIVKKIRLEFFIY